MVAWRVEREYVIPLTVAPAEAAAIQPYKLHVEKMGILSTERDLQDKLAMEIDLEDRVDLYLVDH